MSEQIIRRRTPAERARYLESRVDDLIAQADKMKAKHFAGAALSLLFSLSTSLADFAAVFEETEAEWPDLQEGVR